VLSYSGYVIPIAALQNLMSLFPFILLADLPFSAVAIGLGWKYPALALIWIFVGGTLWWYLVSRAAKFVINTLFNLRSM